MKVGKLRTQKTIINSFQISLSSLIRSVRIISIVKTFLFPQENIFAILTHLTFPRSGCVSTKGSSYWSELTEYKYIILKGIKQKSISIMRGVNQQLQLATVLWCMFCQLYWFILVNINQNFQLQPYSLVLNNGNMIILHTKTHF